MLFKYLTFFIMYLKKYKDPVRAFSLIHTNDAKWTKQLNDLHKTTSRNTTIKERFGKSRWPRKIS